MIVTEDVNVWSNQYDGERYHALLSDAPYELGFMGREWDKTGVAFQPETWANLSQHLFAGAFLIIFGGSRTYHRLVCAVEDAGLIIHPGITWAFGSGMPKATRIDKTKTAEGKPDPNHPFAGHRYGLQAMKPATEFICVAQKPYDVKPRESIQATGAGALNIEAARIQWDSRSLALDMLRRQSGGTDFTGGRYVHGSVPGQVELSDSPSGRWPANFVLTHSADCARVGSREIKTDTHHPAERPAGNLMTGHVAQDGLNELRPGVETVEEWNCAPSCPVRALDAQSGPSGAHSQVRGDEPSNSGGLIYSQRDRIASNFVLDDGTASRFFHRSNWLLEESDPFLYYIKASTSEREAGLMGQLPCAFADDPKAVHESDPMRSRHHQLLDDDGNVVLHKKGKRKGTVLYVECRRNAHPTVKPIGLTQHLASLLLPPGNFQPRRLLIPFCGSGSEYIGAKLACWESITGIDSDHEMAEIAVARVRHYIPQLSLF
jgi:hypothetical protein